AEAKRFVPWLSALLLKAGSVPPAVFAGWALKKISKHAIGLEDLRPDSDFLKKLNNPEGKAEIPYFILAGDNPIPPAEQGAWKRFTHQFAQGLDKSLDFLFGDQHDLVISVNSMVTVRGGQYPAEYLQTKRVPCNHFEYFANEEARGQLAEWVKAENK
ncbi:MAG: hypothetical protein GY862_21830, partial [Gammaproteobacteria bacterium]|nr:hypothetical protein [Gammaproteobacteria bacterium]